MPGKYTPRQPAVRLVCPYCETSFHLPAWVVRQGARYYTQSCARRDAIPVGRRLTQRVCETCRATFMADPRAIRRGWGRFCSKRCYGAARAIPAEDRFHARRDISGDCWPWTAGRNGNGYGVLAVTKGHNVLAHVFAWNLVAGPVPKGFTVCHACDVPACTRNDEPGIYLINGVARPRFGHLWLGTQAENVADMVNKGRHWSRNVSA
jgi:hypothetical protein